jgi:hypothetical protein
VLLSSSLPGSLDRLYWFKLGVLGNIGVTDCLKAWLGWVFICQFHAKDRLKKLLPFESPASQRTLLYQAYTDKTILPKIKFSTREPRETRVVKTRHEKTRWHVLQIMNPIIIRIRRLYLSTYLEFPTAPRVFFHGAANYHAEIYFDQPNINSALQLVVASAD